VASAPNPGQLSRVRRLWFTPKGQLLVVFGLLLAVAAPAAGGLALLPNLAAAVLIACTIDVLWQLAETRRLLRPTSALLSALIVFFILSPNESWLVVGWTSAFAVIAKRVVRTQREHIFNPAALALVWAPIAFGSGESWWGALGDLPWPWMALLLACGVWVVQRLNKFPTVLTFLAVYFAFFTGVATTNPRAVAEMFREPFVQAALFLALFMLTDPPTSPNRYTDQVWYAALAAVGAGLAQIAGAGQVYLLLGVLLANAVLAVVRHLRRRGETIEPATRAADEASPSNSRDPTPAARLVAR
jgi:Na+-translocating ferredoxin:NAD+ oxidoreductase RnfD subunit